MSDRKNRSHIDPVQPAVPQQPAATGWVALGKAVNPFGPAVEAYARTLAYRLESKRLALEAKRVREQAQVVNNVIDKTYKLKMEELEHRRIALERTFDLADMNLDRLYIERSDVLKMANTLQKELTKDGLSLEERTLFKELIVELIKQLPQFGESAQKNLESLVQALPPIEMPRALLTGE